MTGVSVGAVRSGEGDNCECGCSEKVRVTGMSVGAVRR